MREAADMVSRAWRSHRRLLLVETVVAVVVNCLLSVVAAYLFTGKMRQVPLWGAGGMAVDLFPTYFMITLMTSLIPTLLIHRRLATGAVEPLSVPARSRLAGVRPVTRALLFAAAAALLLAPSTAALLGLFGLAQLPFGAFVAFKAGLAIVYAAVITPPLVALALSS
jgi:hypothetical protein